MPSYQHEWVCIYCGKVIRRTTSSPNPPYPFAPKDCKGNPAGPKMPHVFEKVR
jgi:hypothetical protein